MTGINPPTAPAAATTCGRHASLSDCRRIAAARDAHAGHPMAIRQRLDRLSEVIPLRLLGAGRNAIRLTVTRVSTAAPGHAQARVTAAPGQAPGPCPSRRGSSDRGAGAAEMVIAVPLLMLLILLVVQFAIWAHATHVAQATAEEALAAARVQGGTAAAGQARAQQVLDQIGSAVLTSPHISVTRTAPSATVQVRATAEQVLPVPGLTLPVRATVAGPAERFVPDSAGE